MPPLTSPPSSADVPAPIGASSPAGVSLPAGASLPAGSVARAVLILGGTTEGRLLAAACADLPGVTVVSSLAGRTTDPLALAGRVRIGGFGGVPGLVDYLREERIAAVVDATHPFAAGMTANAAEAAAATGVPLLVVRRPGFGESPGDRWHRVPSLAAAASLVGDLGTRVFLTSGRQGIAAFAGLERCWFLSRSVEPPSPPMPAQLEVVLDRGPFTLAGELGLMREHRIDVLVTKDSGGAAPKLEAARTLHIPVVMIDRPPPPPSATVATAVAEAITWLGS
jgi:precorrin-6A/cobalt-precorrin-6A reductase